jgi:hypothetical protein
MSERQVLNRSDLRSIATYQKVIVLCILVYLIAVIARFVLPTGLGLILMFAVGGVGIVATVFVFLLATKIYTTGVGILLGVLTLIPIVGLIVLLIVNGKATAILKSNGIKVGLLGARMSDLG